MRTMSYNLKVALVASALLGPALIFVPDASRAQGTWNTFQCLSRTFKFPVGFDPVCTMSWTLEGAPCDGADFVDRWPKITRMDGVVIKDWRMRPWRAEMVAVRSFHIVKLDGGPHANVMIGNNFVADDMLSIGANETSGWSGTVEKAGFPFPGTANDPGDAYFDLHGNCTGGGNASFRVTIAYTPLGIAPSARAPTPPINPIVAWSTEQSGSNLAPNASIRNLVPLGATGTKFRARFKAGSGGPFTVTHASVGMQIGQDTNTVTTPLELTFSGASGFTIPAGASVSSDWILFTTVAGNVVVTFDTAALSYDTIATPGGATKIGYVLNGATFNLHSPRLSGVVAGTIHGLEEIEVGD